MRDFIYLMQLKVLSFLFYFFPVKKNKIVFMVTYFTYEIRTYHSNKHLNNRQQTKIANTCHPLFTA